MARRAKDWNEGLSEDLKDLEFASEFMLSSIEEGIPIQEVIGKVVRSMGIKEFSKIVNIPSSNIERAINPDHNPTRQTLEKLLKPFGLKLSIAKIAS